jgi:hypothetical protein
MNEYWITITFTVKGDDIEEANEIGNSLIAAAKKGDYKVESAEVVEIEEA